MIVYKNKDETIRIRKEYEDRNGRYFYILEKWIKPDPSWIDKLLKREPKGDWVNGRIYCGSYLAIPPSKTYDLKIVISWVKHYELQESLPVVVERNRNNENI